MADLTDEQKEQDRKRQEGLYAAANCPTRNLGSTITEVQVWHVHEKRYIWLPAVDAAQLFAAGAAAERAPETEG